MRVLVTCAEIFMGPAIVELFEAEGHEVVVDQDPLVDPEAPQRLIEASGPLDALIINLDFPVYRAKTVDIEDNQWLAGFDALVHPLMRLVRAAAPNMITAGSGAIVSMNSSSPLRRMRPIVTSYVVARAAQNAFVRSAGHELARHGVRLNAVAQNYVASDTYYPPELRENETFLTRLKQDVPAGRLGEGAESAELALFLATQKSSFIFGQIISQDGGWS